MVLAISMQKLDTQYSGLADSYYLAAMGYMEEVIRPKDIKTLQCLVLVAQYSLLTPTRTAIYYVVGLATRLCQQLGLAEEKTITQGVELGMVNPIQLDMKRRLSWIVLSMELGLAHSMGRPNAFAAGEDHVDVGFFEAVDDEYITADGILPAPVSEKKQVAIHFFRMRLLQAEMRKVLYQKKRPEPKNEDHPWYAQMEKKLKDWLNACPQSPTWSKPWCVPGSPSTLHEDLIQSRFEGSYNTMIVTLRRPSPQVPKPSARSAMMCYDASAENIRTQSKHLDAGNIDITWIFLLTVLQAVNTILWAISYPEVRVLHPKEELEENIEIALDIIDKCRERWPGTAAASQLYSKLAKACLRSYDVKTSSHPPSSLSTNSPSSLTDTNSPSASEHSSVTTNSIAHSQQSTFQPPPQFGCVFNQMPEQIQTFSQSMGPPPPAFRSNSIFGAPSSMQSDRRFSYFPPEFTQPNNLSNAWNPMPDSQAQPQTQFQVPLPPANPTIADASYVMDTSTTPTSFGNFMWGGQDYDVHMRQGSLSQQQQIELMQSLETDGLAEIDNFMNLSAQYNNPNNFFKLSK
jgi:hypothetical protein